MRTPHLRLAPICALLILLALSGCGGGGGSPGGPGNVTPPGGPGQPADALDATLHPLNTGDVRAWRSVDDAQGRRLRIERVDGVQTVPGGQAFAIKSTADQGAHVAVEYLQVRSGGVYSVAGPGSDPLTAAAGSVQVFRAGLGLGQTAVLIDQTLSADVNGDGRADTVEMHAQTTFVAREDLTTRLGSFSSTAHVRTVARSVIRAAGSSTSAAVVFTEDRWYAPGIGPVRARSTTEHNGTRTASSDEEVVAYGVGSVHQPATAARLLRVTPAATERLAPQGEVTLTFDRPVDPLTLWGDGGLVLVDASGKAVSVAPYYPDPSLTEVRFMPLTPLTDGSYVLRNGGKATDISGLPLSSPVATVTVDEHGPTLLSSQPADRAVDIALTGTVRLSFSMELAARPGTEAYLAVWDSRTSTTQNLPARIEGKDLLATLPAPLRTNTTYSLEAGNVVDRLGQPPAFHRVTFTTSNGALRQPQSMMDGWRVGTVRELNLSGPGSRDLVFLALDGSNRMSLFTRAQQADGRWATPLRRHEFTQDHASHEGPLMAADFNGDGRTDLLVSSSFGAYTLLLQQADGTFVPENVTEPGLVYGPPMLASGTDPDGRAWVALASTQMTLWRRLGPQSWVANVTLPVGGPPDTFARDATMADLNGDGLPDWVWIRDAGDGSARQELVWALRDGVAFGAERKLTLPEVWQTRRITVADFNSDGRPDLAIMSSGAGASQQLQLWSQTAAGGFEPAATPSIDMAYEVARFADMNLDGRQDLLLCQPYTVDVLLRSAGGGWQGRQSFQLDQPCTGLQALDWNGDGAIDLIAAGRVLLGSRGPDAWQQGRPAPRSHAMAAPASSLPLGTTWWFRLPKRPSGMRP
ncbi:VCBS repeat-containing protein [Mitsuaria sp. WAJ17]|uniref:FG-GAP-like repeat-containing protein n=1 Tax=Mitsuaria sp. WAJ17 TaxID=2761452 RepID=UPI0016001159|nr:FG-GAP-like repeat-containing protein [Mitsuaria sp. WAJ17]MBB2486727.1 VCBS repeat-containing protein [Mitsuaria sp. WAJ17]